MLHLVSASVRLSAGPRRNGVVKHRRRTVTSVSVKSLSRTPKSYSCYWSGFAAAAARTNAGTRALLGQARNYRSFAFLESCCNDSALGAITVKIGRWAAQVVRHSLYSHVTKLILELSTH